MFSLLHTLSELVSCEVFAGMNMESFIEGDTEL